MTRSFYAATTLIAYQATVALHAGATPLTTTRVAAGLTQPLDIQISPNDRTHLYVAERTGRIRRVDATTGAIAPTPLLDLSSLVNTSWLEWGLLGFCFDPDYANNGYVYVNYSDLPSANSVIARYQRSVANPNVLDPASRIVVLYLVQPNQNHRGGQLAFGPDGYLYLTFGDGGGQNDPNNRAQNLTLLQGKMLRIDPSGDDFPGDANANYAIPPTNPFIANGPPFRAEIWAYGLRNPWRFSFDRETGDLYIADVGQNQREELNFEPAGFAGGRNYGWRCTEGTLCTGLSGCTCNGAGLTPPIFEYSHSVGLSITGGYVYRGCAMPDMHGIYFYAEYQFNKLFSLRYANGVVTEAVERTAELDPPGALTLVSVAALGQDWDGELYYADYNGGEIFKLVPNGVPAASCLLAGDMNCDGVVTVSDIGPFVLALTDPAAYAAQFPNCDAAAADLNQDGSVSVSDIGPFVSLLTS